MEILNPEPPLFVTRGPLPVGALLCHVGVGPNARAEFEAAPSVGACYLDLDDDLSGPPGGAEGRHPLPTPEHFAEALGRAGVADDARVVAYDTRGGAYASRLVWMLRVIGQPASLWVSPSLPKAERQPGTDQKAAHGPRTEPNSAVRPWPTRWLADADEVAAHIASGGLVIDSRDANRYRGEHEPIDPVAGHIPGALNLPHRGNLDAGRPLPQPALAARFSAVAKDPDAIVYCGSGVTACMNALAMEAAGLPRPRLYVGSWSGWIGGPQPASGQRRNVALGPDPEELD